jgi:hypothetical protein
MNARKSAEIERLRRFDPFRTARWRWLDACDLVDKGRRTLRGRDPDWRIETVAYLRASRACRNERDHKRLAKRWPDLDRARQLADDDGPLRWEVEARLLAGQNDAEIAHRSGISSQAVSLYESLFLDVRDKLQASGWILIHALRTPGTLLFYSQDLATIWREFAYYRGPLVLNDVIAVSLDRPLPKSARERHRGKEEGFEERLRLSCRLAIDAEMLPPDIDPRVLLRLHSGLLHETYSKQRQASVSIIQMRTEEVLAEFQGRHANWSKTKASA